MCNFWHTLLLLYCKYCTKKVLLKKCDISDMNRTND